MNTTNYKTKACGRIALPAAILLLSAFTLPQPTAAAAEDQRTYVELPEMMQRHMLANMRDHLEAVNEILVYLGAGEFDKAADTAEYRLGMSSLESHGANHMARFMPQGMRAAGSAMHQAASRFARVAEEGDALPAYRALAEITAACVACHSAYRIQ